MNYSNFQISLRRSRLSVVRFLNSNYIQSRPLQQNSKAKKVNVCVRVHRKSLHGHRAVKIHTRSHIKQTTQPSTSKMIRRESFSALKKKKKHYNLVTNMQSVIVKRYALFSTLSRWRRVLFSHSITLRMGRATRTDVDVILKHNMCN